MTSWKTTASGVLAIVVALGSAVLLLLDGDAATNPDWNAVIAAVLAGIGLILARDNSRSSESVGAK